MLRDDSVRFWPQHLRKKLQSECKIVENRIYYRDRLLILGILGIYQVFILKIPKYHYIHRYLLR